MLNEKVIFLDIDGTLVDHTLYPSASTVEAVTQAKANGHKIFLNTGRSVCQVYDYIWDLGFDGFIGGNGIYIEENGVQLFHKAIPQPLVEKVYSYLVDREIGFFEEGQESLYAHPQYLPELAKLLESSTDEVKEWTMRLFPTTAFDCQGPFQNVNKISLVLTERANFEEIRDFIKPDLVIGEWRLFGKEREFADIYQAGTSKGTAVEFVMNHLNKALSEAVCIGDAGNDIDMVKIAGLGIAMGNSLPELKQAADYVTDTVTNDGIYKAFKFAGLI